MATFMQWLHVMAAVVGLGGMGFLLLILIPALGVLNPEHREALSKAVAGRFRWASWSAMALLLIISGIYNIRHYWEEPWGRAWRLLAFKILLSFGLFGIVVGLSIPLRLFEGLRARRRVWLLVAFILGVIVVLLGLSPAWMIASRTPYSPGLAQAAKGHYRKRRAVPKLVQIKLCREGHNLRLRRLLCGMAPPSRCRRLPTNLICAGSKA